MYMVYLYIYILILNKDMSYLHVDGVSAFSIHVYMLLPRWSYYVNMGTINASHCQRHVVTVSITFHEHLSFLSGILFLHLNIVIIFEI